MRIAAAPVYRPTVIEQGIYDTTLQEPSTEIISKIVPCAHFKNEALPRFIQNVLRSTLLHPNEVTKRNLILRHFEKHSILKWLTIERRGEVLYCCLNRY